MELKYSEKNRSVCHNQHHSTQTDQELRPDICVERLASNRMSPVMLLFLAAQESQFIQSLNFLPSGTYILQNQKALLLVVYITNGLREIGVTGLEPVTRRYCSQLGNSHLFLP